MKICANCHIANEDDESCCTECGHTSFENSAQVLAGQPQPFFLFGYSLGRKEEIHFHQRCLCCCLAWAAAIPAMAIVARGFNSYLLMSPFITPAGVLVIFLCNSTLDSELTLIAGAIAGWAYYVILTAASLCAKRRRIFVLVFVILCVSLLLNIAGCEALKHSNFHT
jgi:hypothetical protein